MVKSNKKNRSEILNRGTYGNFYLQTKYETALAQAVEERLPPWEELLQSYYMYLCTRKVRLTHLTGAFSLKAIGDCLEYAANTLFEMLRGDTGVKSSETESAEARASIVHEEICGHFSRQFALGRSNEFSQLNANAVLGNSAAAMTPLLNIELAISLKEWNMLSSNPLALVSFHSVCDLMVPLNLNFRISFIAKLKEGSFALPVTAQTTDMESVNLPVIVGFNSFLRIS